VAGQGNISGTGTVGATITVIDPVTGDILGQDIVAADGTYNVVISGGVAGASVAVLQNGIPSPRNVAVITNNPDNSFLSENIFRPNQGLPLDIVFRSPQNDRVVIRIYNLAAELVRPVAEMDVTAGVLFSVQWDGTNTRGETVASGVYFVSVSGRYVRSIRKVIVLK
jgi:hypothetical protein